MDSVILTMFFYLLLAFVTCLLVLFLGFLSYLHYIHKINEHLPGPPRSSFIFGHLLDLSQCNKEGGSYFHYLLEKRSQYGSVFAIFLLHKAVVYISDPAYIREILPDFNQGSKTKWFYDKIGYIFGQRFVGNSILTNLDDESWHKRRQLMNPAFHRKCLKDFMADFNEVCDRFLVRMMGVVKGKQETNMQQEFTRATLDALSQVSFNVKIGAIEDPNNPFSRAIITALRGAEANVLHPFNATLLSIFQFRLFQSASQKEQIDAAKFLREFALECVTNRINDIKANKDVPNDLLNLLVNDKSLSIDDIIDEFVVIFFAGHDTTANSTAFALYEILRNPDFEAKILNEVNDVLGSKEHVDFEDLPKLRYVGQVLQESLRKYPVARGPERMLRKEVTVGGYKIPKGTMVLLEKSLLSYNPEIWPNPDVFDPDRFSEPEKIPDFNMHYFPFSLGPRNCIGQNFAKFESKILLARLLRKFQFQLCPGQTGTREERITVAPRDGVVCNVMLRSQPE